MAGRTPYYYHLKVKLDKPLIITNELQRQIVMFLEGGPMTQRELSEHFSVPTIYVYYALKNLMVREYVGRSFYV